MARYIKVNPKVAQYLNLQNDRLAVKDGNYILWQADMLAFGPLTRLSETLPAIGAISLMPHEARQEQDGVMLRPLPVATDPRFIIPAPAVADTEAPAETQDETADTPEDDEPGETGSDTDKEETVTDKN